MIVIKNICVTVQVQIYRPYTGTGRPEKEDI